MAYSWSTLSSARATFLRDELPLRHVVGGEQHHSPNRRCAKTLEQEVEGGSTHGVHIITVATSPRPELVLLERSIRKAFGAKERNITKSTACSYGCDGSVPWRFTVLGLGRRWDGLGCKLDWFVAYLRCVLHRHLTLQPPVLQKGMAGAGIAMERNDGHRLAPSGGVRGRSDVGDWRPPLCVSPQGAFPVL